MIIESKTTLKNRNSSIELLRIIAENGVIILHLNNGNIGGGFSFVEEIYKLD